MGRRGATKKSRGGGSLTHGYVAASFRVKCDASNCVESTETLSLNKNCSSLQEAAASIWQWVEESDGEGPFVHLCNGGWQYLLEDKSG